MWQMDHRIAFPNAALMWWCGTGLAADQLAIAMGRQRPADQHESPPPDARMVAREFALLSFLS
jgi:hypothetical protein